MEFAYLAIGFLIAFAPAITAAQRKHRSRLAIAFLDVASIGTFIGGAFVTVGYNWLLGAFMMFLPIFGWFWAMLWSLTGNVES